MSLTSTQGYNRQYQFDDADNRIQRTTNIPGPNPIDWTNASSTTTATVGAAFTNYQTITGVPVPITLRFSVTYAGDLSTGSFNVYSSTRNLFLATVPLGGGAVDVLVDPGESLNLYADASSSADQRSATWTATVTNLSNGGSPVDSTQLSTVVNTPDYTLEPVSFFSAGNYPNDGTGNATVTNGGGYATGINRPISMYAVVSPVFRGGTANSFFTVYVGAGSASWSIGEITPKTFYWTTNPGDFIGASAALSQFNAGDAYAYWHVEIYNGTTNEPIGGYDGGLSSTR